MDRYTKIVLTVIAVALVVIAARPLLPSVLERALPGVAQAQTIAPKYEVAVPKAWGTYIAFSNGNLLLEARDGWGSSTSRVGAGVSEISLHPLQNYLAGT